MELVSKEDKRKTNESTDTAMTMWADETDSGSMAPALKKRKVTWNLSGRQITHHSFEFHLNQNFSKYYTFILYNVLHGFVCPLNFVYF
jgi:hypothetical protein